MAKKPRVVYVSKTAETPATVLQVTLRPETWIIAPRTTKEFLRRWGLDEHLDRAFPRNSSGKPILFKSWLEAPMRRACNRLGLDMKLASNWSIIDEHGYPINYVTIPEEPLIYKRCIETEKGQTLEVFEFIDGSYTIEFRAKPFYDPKKFIQILAVAGRVGLLARTGKGYGKFTIEVKLPSNQ